MLELLKRWWSARARPKPLGRRGEDAASRHLKRLGYHIVARNVDSPLGELDIVAVDDRTVVFVEVKTRTSADAGSPTDAIDSRKQQRMTQSALAYLKTHGLLEHSARFDVVAVTWSQGARRPAVKHIQNAFPASGRRQFFS